MVIIYYMLDIHPDIDRIIDDTDKLVDQVTVEYISHKVDVRADYLKGTAYISFRIGRDYFKAAKDALQNELLLSGTNLVRSGLENLGDLYYIYCTDGKTNKYARSYIDSIPKFKLAMLLAKVRGLDTTAKERALKQANRWTDASIEQRLEATGPALLTMYDMMSYFSHPNPAATTYLDNNKLLTTQINLVKQCNCINAINLMGITINHSDLKSVNHTDLNAIAVQIGFPLMQAP